jgi:outer membrane receptor protein involved in Fe transport
MKNAIRFVFLLPVFINAQITGKVIETESMDPIAGLEIFASNGEHAVTSNEGTFLIKSTEYPTILIISTHSFLNDTIVVKAAGQILISLDRPVKTIAAVVVSAGRRQQRVEEVPISMEIIRPSLIDNKGITDLEQAVDQSPGVYTMDGQVSIRGGSGFAYGTGSRVLLLWNGMPLLSGYAGDTQWNAIPMEQASQIEIMKGASSVLYGSGALNGVIALSEKEPGLNPETKVKIQTGVYGDPKRRSLRWWNTNPMNQQVEVYRSQMFQQAGYTLSTTFFRNEGYRQGETEARGRVSGTVYFRFKNTSRLKAGIGYNYQLQKTGNFLIWQSDSLGYIPSGGADTINPASTLTYNFGQRLFLDPYLKFTDKKNNKHALKTRIYFANNDNLNNASQSNGATVYFSEYQFQRKFSEGTTITSGLSNIYNSVSSNLFGDHRSNNAAFYSQFEKRINKLDITGGARIEHFMMDGKLGDSDFYYGNDTSSLAKLPVYPILRLGAHYELLKHTHVRASFGQGIRYPSVAERFTQTNVGALNIFPNPNLRPEVGWAAEIGVKQGVKIGDWKGMLDVAAFINEYNNMMEFTFGVYKPDSVTLSPANLKNYVGFQAQNTEKARISGIEFSFNSIGSIGDVQIVSLLGYTYMNPITLNTNPNYLSFMSDTTGRILKYRFKHLAKADVEFTYKMFSLGFSCRYNSNMVNIDRVFQEDLDPTSAEIYILPGLKDYREKQNKGALVFDARFALPATDKYRVSFIVNNLFNNEYMTRPGDIQPPRSFLIQIQMKF